jgi:hypothetical protein
MRRPFCARAHVGILPTRLSELDNQGYIQSLNSPRYQLALQYLKERNFWPDLGFDHSLDCEYLDNFCHVNVRGQHKFFRPSACVKFPLRQASSPFSGADCLTSYHGTPSSNISSILAFGLLPAGESIGGISVVKRNGEALGPGVYTSPSPLYAQLYAPIEIWRGYFVQTVLMVRQPARDLVTYQDEGCSSCSLIGRDDIWRLYGGSLAPGELQMKTTAFKDVVIQAILVKIHDSDPRLPGGEYHHIRTLLEKICEESE